MKTFFLIILFIIFAFVLSNDINAQSIGPNNPSSNSFIGVGTSWIDRFNAYTDNNKYTLVQLKKNEVSNYLILTGFGFLIPYEATIIGITVKVERSHDNDGGGNIKIENLYLTKTGLGSSGNNTINNRANWSKNMELETHGDSVQLWGTTWTPEEINSPNFGVMIQIKKQGGSDTKVGYIDYVSVKVNYIQTPLPIDLLYFNASIDCDKTKPYIYPGVKFDWVTLSETNNEYFTIESSENGKTFKEDKKVFGAINSINRIEYIDYIFYDYNNIPEYFKLKQIDFDGKYTYSKTIGIKKCKNMNWEIKENGTNNVSIDFFVVENTPKTFIFFDELGREVKRKTFVESGNKILYIDNLESGLYIVKMESSFGTNIKK